VGLKSWSGQRLQEKCFASAGDQTPAVQSVVTHYSRVSQPGFREMSLGVPRDIMIEKK
jgi:hypothetical protein